MKNEEWAPAAKEWQRMLADKIDVTAFFTWFIEHYPASAQSAKTTNEDFWKKFR